MSFSSNMRDFPSIASYSEALAHFDAVKPIRGDYSGKKPIAGRGTNQRHKNMRQLSDGSIAFRFHRTDCVTWHPDNSLTVIGYASMSTSAFISPLTPVGVSHGQGPKDEGEPVLHLQCAIRPQVDHLPWEEQRPVYREYWRSGVIVRADQGVTLDYDAATQTWLPRDPDDLPPFRVKTIDRKASRAVSKQYQLALLEQVVHAAVALGAAQSCPGGSETVRMGAIMERLEAGEIMAAIALMPRGQVEAKWGRRTIGTPNGIQPGFLRKLRDHIYDHEGVIETVEERVLTVAGYQRYLTNQRKFGY